MINGGPMMGRAVSNLDAPVTKGTSGILLMEATEAARPAALPLLDYIRLGKAEVLRARRGR